MACEYDAMLKVIVEHLRNTGKLTDRHRYDVHVLHESWCPALGGDDRQSCEPAITVTERVFPERVRGVTTGMP